MSNKICLQWKFFFKINCDNCERSPLVVKCSSDQNHCCVKRNAAQPLFCIFLQYRCTILLYNIVSLYKHSLHCTSFQEERCGASFLHPLTISLYKHSLQCTVASSLTRRNLIVGRNMVKTLFCILQHGKRRILLCFLQRRYFVSIFDWVRI